MRGEVEGLTHSSSGYGQFGVSRGVRFGYESIIEGSRKALMSWVNQRVAMQNQPSRKTRTKVRETRRREAEDRGWKEASEEMKRNLPLADGRIYYPPQQGLGSSSQGPMYQ